jgi:hypothetical protein
MRLDEFAGMAIRGAGESALLMAEQDAFDEIFGDGAAIDGDERFRAAVAAALYGARHHLLADAGFAFNHDRNARGCGLLAEPQHAFHRRAACQQVPEGEYAGGTPRHPSRLPLGRTNLQRTGDRRLDALGRCRLDDEIESAVAHGLHDRFNAALRGLNDDRHADIALAHGPEHADPIQPRHRQVEDHDRNIASPVEGPKAGLSAIGNHGLVTEFRDRRLQQPALDRIVIDYEHGT